MATANKMIQQETQKSAVVTTASKITVAVVAEFSIN